MTERRHKLLADAAYFAIELRRRLEALEAIEPNSQTQSWWHQAAAVTTRIRRHALEEDRQRRLIEARRARAARIRATMR
jgi:hypothetical protein